MVSIIKSTDGRIRLNRGPDTRIEDWMIKIGDEVRSPLSLSTEKFLKWLKGVLDQMYETLPPIWAGRLRDAKRQAYLSQDEKYYLLAVLIESPKFKPLMDEVFVNSSSGQPAKKED